MVNLLLIVFLAALATFRLSRLVADETGPWRIFEKLRDATPEGSNLREGINCIMCVSVWISLLIAWWLWCGLRFQQEPYYCENGKPNDESLATRKLSC